MEDDDLHQSLFSWLSELGPILGGALVFSIVCTAWLVGGRILGALRFRDPNPVREMAFLISGPVCTILISIIKVAIMSRYYVRGGLDTDLGLIWTLRKVVGIGLIGLVCFVTGVCSLMLPAKTKPKLP